MSCEFVQIGCFLLLLLGNMTSAQNTRCFLLSEGGYLCFIQPSPPVALSWSSALQWCKTNGATLPIPDNTYHNAIYGNALDYFGLQSGYLWVGANSTYNLNNWYWSGGAPFTGIFTFLLLFSCYRHHFLHLSLSL